MDVGKTSRGREDSQMDKWRQMKSNLDQSRLLSSSKEMHPFQIYSPGDPGLGKWPRAM